MKSIFQARLKVGLLVLLSALPVSAATATATPRTDADATVVDNSPRESNSRARRGAQRNVGQYFIEFRSRYALSYGHTFAAFGRLNGRGKILQSEVAGLHPAGDSPVPWMIGHVLMVPSETGPSIGDLDDRYVSARFRVNLNEQEYVKLAAHIKELQANSPTWHAIFYNCNAFVADIAKFMGLETPTSTILYPADFINNLRSLNEGRRPSFGETG